MFDVYLSRLIFSNNIWDLFKLFETALLFATYKGCNEIVKLLLEQKGIDVNAKNVYLFYSKFFLIVSFPIIICGIYLKYLKWRL